MSPEIKQLMDWGPRKQLEVLIDDVGMMDFTMLAEVTRDPQVYFWVNGTGNLLYIGKAGKGVKKRLSEHKGGAKREPHKAKKINEEVQKNGKITVYAYTLVPKFHTKVSEITGEELIIDITGLSEEEDALIKKFNPIWNTNGKV